MSYMYKFLSHKIAKKGMTHIYPIMFKIDLIYTYVRIGYLDNYKK